MTSARCLPFAVTLGICKCRDADATSAKLNAKILQDFSDTITKCVENY